MRPMKILDRAQSRLPQPWRTIVDWTVTIVVAVGIVLTVEAEMAKPYRIPSSSMEPTLHCARPGNGCTAMFNDRVIVDRLAYRLGEPKRGQIVVFDAPAAADSRCAGGEGGTFVKRLIGLPGDRVSLRDGFVYVNGKRLKEPYVSPSRRGAETRTFPRVAAGRYFFLGDNRVGSCDSRVWGTVARDDLIGPVLATYWPPTRLDLR